MRLRLGTMTMLILTPVLMVGSRSARADDIDVVLRSNARSLVKQLSEKGFTSVGVLKFEVQTGGPDGPVSLHQGRLTETLPTRLENVLALALTDKTPLGIIRDASGVAAKADPGAGYHSKDARTKLFNIKYPLAWGTDQVACSAMLVGRVQFDKPMKTAIVSLRGFSANHPAEWFDLTLKQNTVSVTRSLLSDINQPFVVPASFFRKRGSDAELADPFEQSADSAAVPIEAGRKGSLGRTPETQPEEKKPETQPEEKNPLPLPPPPQPNEKTLDWLDHLLSVNLYYDKQLVARLPDGNYPPPAPGQTVHFTLKATERLGVVLLVNGMNTADYDRESKSANSYVKWILEPNTEYWIRGYYAGDKLYPFAVANKADGEKQLSDLTTPDQFGLIEVHIYKEIREELLLARRGLALGDSYSGAKTLADLKKEIQTKTLRQNASKPRSLIIPGDGQTIDHLQSTDFMGTLAAKVILRYSPPPKSLSGSDSANR